MALLDVTVGEAVRVAVSFSFESGAAMPATGVAIQARRPDGTIIDGTVLPGAGEGQFEAWFTTDAPGVWLTKAKCDGPAVVLVEGRFSASTLHFDRP